MSIDAERDEQKTMWKWLLTAGLLAGLGYLGYDYYEYKQAYREAGFDTMPVLQAGEFPVSFQASGFRGVMRGLEDERDSRKYLGYPADVPKWYEESWSYCRAPSDEERRGFLQAVDIGPGGRFDAICEINADGEVFVRGWVISVPDL